jgi:hypothetical protein
MNYPVFVSCQCESITAAELTLPHRPKGHDPLPHRSVYDFPKKHQVIIPLSPSADAITQALVGLDRTRLQPAGACAANTYHP